MTLAENHLIFQSLAHGFHQIKDSWLALEKAYKYQMNVITEADANLREAVIPMKVRRQWGPVLQLTEQVSMQAVLRGILQFEETLNCEGRLLSGQCLEVRLPSNHIQNHNEQARSHITEKKTIFQVDDDGSYSGFVHRIGRSNTDTLPTDSGRPPPEINNQPSIEETSKPTLASFKTQISTHHIEPDVRSDGQPKWTPGQCEILPSLSAIASDLRRRGSPTWPREPDSSRMTPAIPSPSRSKSVPIVGSSELVTTMDLQEEPDTQLPAKTLADSSEFRPDPSDHRRELCLICPVIDAIPYCFRYLQARVFFGLSECLLINRTPRWHANICFIDPIAAQKYKWWVEQHPEIFRFQHEEDGEVCIQFAPHAVKSLPNTIKKGLEEYPVQGRTLRLEAPADMLHELHELVQKQKKRYITPPKRGVSMHLKHSWALYTFQRLFDLFAIISKIKQHLLERNLSHVVQLSFPRDTSDPDLQRLSESRFIRRPDATGTTSSATAICLRQIALSSDKEPVTIQEPHLYTRSSEVADRLDQEVRYNGSRIEFQAVAANNVQKRELWLSRHSYFGTVVNIGTVNAEQADTLVIEYKESESASRFLDLLKSGIFNIHGINVDTSKVVQVTATVPGNATRVIIVHVSTYVKSIKQFYRSLESLVSMEVHSHAILNGRMLCLLFLSIQAAISVAERLHHDFATSDKIEKWEFGPDPSWHSYEASKALSNLTPSDHRRHRLIPWVSRVRDSLRSRRESSRLNVDPLRQPFIPDSSNEQGLEAPEPQLVFSGGRWKSSGQMYQAPENVAIVSFPERSESGSSKAEAKVSHVSILRARITPNPSDVADIIPIGSMPASSPTEEASVQAVVQGTAQVPGIQVSSQGPSVVTLGVPRRSASLRLKPRSSSDVAAGMKDSSDGALITRHHTRRARSL